MNNIVLSQPELTMLQWIFKNPEFETLIKSLTDLQKEEFNQLKIKLGI